MDSDRQPVTLMRKIKQCGMALLWIKAKIFSDFLSTCVKFSVGSGSGSASKWKFWSGSSSTRCRSTTQYIFFSSLDFYECHWTFFQDELKIASSEEDKKYVVELFERGVQVIPTRYSLFMFHILVFGTLSRMFTLAIHRVPLSILYTTLRFACSVWNMCDSRWF